MQIKTIWQLNPTTFDDQVNAALAEGWMIARRDMLPDKKDLGRSVLYAELVKPDEPAEPQSIDPIEALHAIKSACLATPVEACGAVCPLRSWCEQLRAGGDPTDWVLPGEGLEP